MCTVSWTRKEEGYVLFFNRDEQHARPEAEPPRLWEGEGCSFLSPRDPQGGGSWLAVNQAGLSIGLLNYYEQAATHPPGSRSRGLLVRDLASAASVAEVGERMHALDGSLYAPFHLLAIAPGGAGGMWTWNGARLIAFAAVEEPALLATSSVRPAEVIAQRRRIYAEIVRDLPPAPERLAAFHRQFDPAAAAESVAMRREDARTVSLSEIVVGRRGILYRYYPRRREQDGFDPPLEVRLERTPA